MRGQRHGRIVTIASIGGKLSAPHLLPYSTAKFAAVGFSDAERAARQIVGAVRERRAEIILTPAGQIASRTAGLAPGLTSEVLRFTRQLALPAPAGPAAGGEGAPGQDLDPAISPKVFDRLTALGRAAAGRFNERQRGPTG